MKLPPSRFVPRLMAGASVLAVALTAAAPAFAQRASLAERVARLEQQQAQSGGPSSVDQVNRMTVLQSEVQALRSQVEQLQNDIATIRQQNRDQYLDLDGRLGRLEGRAPGAVPGVVTAPPAAPSETPGEPAAPLAGGPSQAGTAAPEPGAPDAAAQAPADPNAAPPAPADPAAERAAYQSAFDALKEGQYAEAANRFGSFLQQYPQSELADNGHYWLGESYYVTQNYELALESFQTLVQRFPQSPKAPGALLKTGYCQLELKQFDAGEATLRQVIEQYPGTTEASLADGRLRGLRLDRQG